MVGVQVFRKLSGHFPDTFDAHFSARADDAAPARIPPTPSRASEPPAAPSPAVVRDEKSPVSSSRAFPKKTNPPPAGVGVRSFSEVSGNFPDTFRTLLTRTSRPERTTRRPRSTPPNHRARPRRPPSRRPPRVETKSHPSRRRARFRKKRTRGSAFNFSGNFPETPDGVSRDCTDAPEHPRGSTKPPRRRIARFTRVFVPPFPYVVPFLFPSTRR